MEQNQQITPPLPDVQTDEAKPPRRVFTSWKITSLPYLIAAAVIVSGLYFSGLASFRLGLAIGGWAAVASFIYGLSRRISPCKPIYMCAIIAGALTFLFPEDRGAFLYIISFIAMCYFAHFLGYFTGTAFWKIGGIVRKWNKT